MKWIFFILISTVLLNCNKIETTNTEKNNLVDTTIQSNITATETADKKDRQLNDCKSEDFLQLKDSDLQIAFFDTLEAMLKIQYPDNNRPSDSHPDLTSTLLNQFLKDIDVDELS